MSKKNKLVQGWGINDADYSVYKTEVINGKSRQVWVCPYYKKWSAILERCFSKKLHTKYPTYKDCTVTEDWKYLSNFIKWVDSQPNRDWENCEPDKDLLFTGNKEYNKNTTVFITSAVNKFMTDSHHARGSHPIGVRYIEGKLKCYQARCNNPFTRKRESLGYFSTAIQAHKAWQAKKYEHACQLADLQQDPHVAKALRERYAPDKDWTGV